MEPIVEVELTAPEIEWLARFTRQLVEERLVACGSIESAEVRSIYRWQGAIEDQLEGRVRFHTRLSLVKQVHSRVDQRHPYEVPGFRWWQINASAAYHQWVLDCTS